MRRQSIAVGGHSGGRQGGSSQSIVVGGLSGEGQGDGAEITRSGHWEAR